MNTVTIKYAECADGPMLYLPNDAYIGRSLDTYGEFSRQEHEFFSFAAQRGGAAIDVGANVGAHSLFMAKRYEQLFAFEPQPLLHRLLRANLSDFPSAITYPAVCGNDETIIYLPTLNYAIPNNFGGVGKYCLDGMPDEQRKSFEMFKCQQRMIDRCEAIQAAEKISLLKVDVEGMEKEVLEGARQTIAKHQPLLYVENDRPDKSQALVDYIYNVLAYRAWWHITMLFQPSNFRGAQENIFPGMASFNLICVPDGHWSNVVSTRACTPESPFVPEGCKV